MRSRPLRPLAAAAAAAALALAAAGCSRTSGPRHLARAGEVTVDAPELAAFIREEKHVEVGTLDIKAREEGLRRLLTRKALAAAGERAGLAQEEGPRRKLFQWRLKTYPKYFWQRLAGEVVATEEELLAEVAPQPQYLVSAMVFYAGEEGEEEAREAHRLLAAGGDFAAIARERSQGILRDKGGDMGWLELPNRSIDDASAARLRALAPGEYTAPLETLIGWVIYQVRDVRTADEIFAQRRDEVRGTVEARKVEAERRETMRGLRERAHVVYPDPQPGRPTLIIDGQPIYRREIGEQSDGRHDFAFRDVTPPREELEKFVDAFLVSAEVERRGWDKDPQLALPAELMRVAALSQAWVNRQAGEAVNVTDAEVEAEYRRYYVPEIYQLQFVLTADRAAAETALAELEGGADFGEVSAKYSAGRVKATQGLVGAMPLSDFPEEVRRAVTEAPDGGHTGVLRNGDGGFLIVKRHGMKRIEVPPLEQLRDTVRQRLLLRKRSDAVKEYVEGFVKGLKVEIDRGLLERLPGVGGGETPGPAVNRTQG